MRVSISGDPCAITNYCMNSYLVLQVATAIRQLQAGFSLCFPRSWLVETGLGLTGSLFWLVERGPCLSLLSCIGQIIAHNSSACSSMSFHVEGEVVRPERISFKDKSSGIIFWENSNLSSGENPHFEKSGGWRKWLNLLNWRAHKWHLNGFWPEKQWNE